MANISAKKILIKGLVQGVGMRHFISLQARKYGLMGHVRNLSNGQVECFIQGKKANIDTFLTTLRTQSPGQVDDIETEDSTSDSTLESFSIKF